MKIVSKDQPLYQAYKHSNGYMSSGFEGPLFFSSKNDGVVTADSKNKDGKVYFIDKNDAESFKAAYDKKAEEYKISHKSSTSNRCEIHDVRENKRMLNNLFGTLDSIAMEEVHTAFGPAYKVISDLEA